MSKEIEVSNIKNELSLTGDDIKRVVDTLTQVKEAVTKVMREGIDNDFAVIPGTKKKSLLKPGAEKLMRLFGLGVRFVVLENIFEREENFAMYSYAAEVYQLKSGTVIAQCEGTANSQEKKYKERRVYVNGTNAGTEPIPVTDIVNTLKKMAQKRAMVGAVIIAVGASDYFSQDEDEIAKQSPVRKEAEKSSADRFGGQAQDHSSYLITFGKHKEKTFQQVGKETLAGYVNFITSSGEPDGKMKELVDAAREWLR